MDSSDEEGSIMIIDNKSEDLSEKAEKLSDKAEEHSEKAEELSDKAEGLSDKAEEQSDSDMEIVEVISKENVNDSYIHLLTHDLRTLNIQSTKNWWPTNDFVTPTLQALLIILPKVIKFRIAEPENIASLGLNLLNIDFSVSREAIQCIIFELTQNHVLVPTRVQSSNSVYQFMDSSWLLLISNQTKWKFDSKFYGLLLLSTSSEMKEKVVLDLIKSWLGWLKTHSKLNYKTEFRKWMQQSDISLLISCIKSNYQLYENVCLILLQVIHMTNEHSESLLILLKYLGGDSLIEQFHLLPASLQCACLPFLYGSQPSLAKICILPPNYITWLAILKNLCCNS